MTELERIARTRAMIGNMVFNLSQEFYPLPDRASFLRILTTLSHALGEEDAGGPITPEAAWRDLIEKDDRTSPEDCPDMALITAEELAAYMLGVRL